jgi:prepilin-type N-terminal cleavage/methylation domain-containing protein
MGGNAMLPVGRFARGARAAGRPARFAPARGFTLIELLVVVAIIALLVAVLVPSLGRAKAITLRVLCAANLRGINHAMAMYTADHNDTYPCAQDPVSANPFYWLWMGRGWRGPLEPYIGGHITQDSPSVLACKADPATKDKYEATSYAYSMSFYHSPAQIDRMSTAAATYSNPQPSIAQRCQDVLRPHEKILIGEWTSNHAPLPDDKGWWCWEGARNFLLADGQVKYVEAAAIRKATDDLPDPNLTIGGIGGRDLD